MEEASRSIGRILRGTLRQDVCSGRRVIISLWFDCFTLLQCSARNANRLYLSRTRFLANINSPNDLSYSLFWIVCMIIDIASSGAVMSMGVNDPFGK